MQLQVLGGEAAPVGARNVHDTELLLPGVEGDAGVVAEAAGAVHEAL